MGKILVTIESPFLTPANLLELASELIPSENHWREHCLEKFCVSPEIIKVTIMQNNNNIIGNHLYGGK